MASGRIEEREKVGKNCEKERGEKQARGFYLKKKEKKEVHHSERRRKEKKKKREKKNRELCKGGSNGLGIE